jgi:membrane associated rhomboid family serine protease
VARRDPFGVFTFGGRVPAAVGAVIALMLIASVGGWIDRGLFGLAALAPAAILDGEVWRLVTWPFFQTDPFGLLFAGFMLWSLGTQLAVIWGDRRLLVRMLGYTVGAAVLTTLLAIVFVPARTPHLGAWPVVNALIFAWAMLYPDRQVNIWGVLPISGRTLGLLVVGGTVLYGIAGGGIGGIGAFSPHLFAILIAWVQSRGLMVRRRGGGVGDAARQWWAERDQKRRARHLKVVHKKGGGDDDRPRWMN